MSAAVVLFAGAGGSSLGLHRAGYNVVGFDNWQPAVDCHNANAMVCHLHDLADPSIDDAIPYAPLWWASPPCQPFSAAGQGENPANNPLTPSASPQPNSPASKASPPTGRGSAIKRSKRRW